MSSSKRLPPLKRFGQNFLQDHEVLNKIIEAAGLSDQDEVLEIGMGQGVLTEALAKKAKKVTTFEIDRGLFAQMSAELGGKYNNIDFIEGDFLDVSEKYWQSIRTKVKVIANIPYNITTPILEKLIEHRDKWSLGVLMVQKEVGERLGAGPGSKAYGSLSVFAQFYMDVEKVIDVSKKCFYPAPKVDSVVIKLSTLARTREQVVSIEKFHKVVRGSFWGRRKTLRNSLKGSPFTQYTDEMLNKLENTLGLDLKRRGETLTIKEFADITNLLFK